MNLFKPLVVLYPTHHNVLFSILEKKLLPEGVNRDHDNELIHRDFIYLYDNDVFILVIIFK